MIAATIMRGLAKSRDARLPSMDAVLDVFDEFLNTGRVHPPTMPPPPANVAALAYAPTVQSTRTSMAAAEARSRSMTAARSRRRRLFFSWGAVVVVVAAGAGLVVRGVRTKGAPPGPTATSVIDLPLPPGTRDDVASEYRQAMDRMRFADVHGSMTHAKSAVALDPTFAPALLFIAIRSLRANASEARDAFRRAQEHEERLTDRDRGLLDAYKPFIQAVPPDLGETRARLDRLVARYPRDAELHALAADLASQNGDYDAAEAELEKARAIDPGFGYVLGMLADAKAMTGDFEGALEATKQCEALGPSVPVCTVTRADIERQLGQCASLEATMRRAVTVEPTMPDWYAPFAEALYAEGRPAATVREVAQQGFEHSTPSLRLGLFVSYYPYVVDLLGGDFTHTEAELLALESGPDVARNLDASAHDIPATLRLEMAWESGRIKDAADVAEQTLARREAWLRDPTHDDFVMGKECEPLYYRALRLAGRIDRAEEDRRRQAWIDRWLEVAPRLSGLVWLKAYAEDVQSKEDATAALEALPRFGALPKAEVDWAIDARIGVVRFLAGDADGALPSLRRAATTCTTLAQPFESMHALAALGAGLEEKGDRAGACAAYARVVKAWGAAKPRSITGERARSRVNALGCATDGGLTR